jgi:uncharacterized membrane protein
MDRKELVALVRPPRWRYLVDIIVLLVAVTFLLDAVLGAFVSVGNLEKGFVVDAIGKMLLVAIGCGLVLLRGERLADIGLKRSENWTRTFMIGIVLAAIVFIAIIFRRKPGFAVISASSSLWREIWRLQFLASSMR